MVIGVAQLGDLVRAFDQAPPFELLDVCERWLAECLGVRASRLLLADYAERVLEPVPHGGRDWPSAASRQPGVSAAMMSHEVSGSPAGVAFGERRTVRVAIQDPSREVTEVAPGIGELEVYVPVSIRAERIGVLLAVLPAASWSVELERTLTDVGSVLGYVLTGARRYTDQFEMLRRDQPLRLPAEMQWELLPVLAYELPQLSIAGALEPTYDIGGDTFDYAVSARELTVTISDAVGHGLRAALLGSLTVTAMRNTRRGGGGITDQAGAANAALAEQFDRGNFVTALLMWLDVSTGSGEIINAGHPPPILLRDGSIQHLLLPPDVPLGVDPGTVYRRQPIALQAGDRLLLLTDGIPEAHHRGQPPFGARRVEELLVAHATHSAARFVAELAEAVLDYRHGKLADDATVVCLDWRG